MRAGLLRSERNLGQLEHLDGAVASRRLRSRQHRALTIDDLLLVPTFRRLVRRPDELINLVLELGLERADLLEHDAQLDEPADDFAPLGRVCERAPIELEAEDCDHVVQVREEQVVLE